MIKAAYRRKILLGLTEGEFLSLAITVGSMAADRQAGMLAESLHLKANWE